MYSYRMTCPVCGFEHEEIRETPYKSVRTKKKCVSCRNLGHPKMAESGIDEDAAVRCGNCAFFGSIKTELPTNRWYKPCSKGLVSEGGRGLVYALDYCGNFRRRGYDGED